MFVNMSAALDGKQPDCLHSLLQQLLFGKMVHANRSVTLKEIVCWSGHGAVACTYVAWWSG